MENMTTAMKDLCYTAAAFGVVIGLILLVRLYCRLTLGMCNCTTDMSGKTVIITGANTGLGKITATELAKKGAHIIMACRNRERGEKALKEIVQETGNHNIVLKDIDLCSFASVRAFAEDILKTETSLHLLINNAGLVGPNKLELTNDGCEKAMQANHLGHFLLTMMLLDLLKKSAPSRVINVSSEAHRFARLQLDDLSYKNTSYGYLTAYSNSKVANVLFSRELAKRLQGTGVTANSLHPGAVKTEFIRPEINFIMRTAFKFIVIIVGKSAFEGAQTTIHLALSPHLGNISGKYFTDCKVNKESRWSKSDERAAHLWRVSEELVGLDTRMT